MKTTIEHRLFGRIEYDTATDKIKVRRPDLEERLTWLMKPKNQHELGTGYWPDTFIRACEVLGIMEEARRVISDHQPPADGGPE
jgi:hypothetical protein